MKNFTEQDLTDWAGSKGLFADTSELVDAPLWYHKAGLQQTATGYGAKLNTGRKIQFEGRLYRLYAFDHASQHNTVEAGFLIDLANKVQEVASGKELSPYFYHPQQEWTGGDSSDPKNFRNREPHIVGNFPLPLEG